MSLKIEIKKVWTWLVAILHSAEHDIAPLVVAITQQLKTDAATGVINFAGRLIDAETKSKIGSEAAGIIERQVPRIWATALAVEHLAENPTPEQIQKFSDDVVAAWNLASTNKGRVLTMTATDLAVNLDAFLTSGGSKTWGEWAKEVQTLAEKMTADLSPSGGQLEDFPTNQETA